MGVYVVDTILHVCGLSTLYWSASSQKSIAGAIECSSKPDFAAGRTFSIFRKKPEKLIEGLYSV